MRLAGAELWSDLACNAGTRLATIPDVVSCRDTRTLDGTDEMVLQMRRASTAWAQVLEKRVVRLQFDDGSWDEWRIGRIEERRSTEGDLLGTLTCAPIMQDFVSAPYLLRICSVSSPYLLRSPFSRPFLANPPAS